MSARKLGSQITLTKIKQNSLSIFKSKISKDNKMRLLLCRGFMHAKSKLNKHSVTLLDRENIAGGSQLQGPTLLD